MLHCHSCIQVQVTRKFAFDCTPSCHHSCGTWLLLQNAICSCDLVSHYAGGCFWGLELAYQRVPGVSKTSVGYTAGHDKSPTYNSVCSGNTGHSEAVQVLSLLWSHVIIAGNMQCLLLGISISRAALVPNGCSCSWLLMPDKTCRPRAAPSIATH